MAAMLIMELKTTNSPPFEAVIRRFAKTEQTE
jgi:hypothetical protein